jgi:SAM-dependent methyltransferase
MNWFKRRRRRQRELILGQLRQEVEPLVATSIDEAMANALNIVASTVDPSGKPNLNALWLQIRDLDVMRINMKNFGYDLARRLYAERDCDEIAAPTADDLGWKASTQADIESGWVRYWSDQLRMRPLYHRKVWEYCYVPQMLHFHGLLRPGMRGLGFACGEEPLPSYLASKGVSVVATDIPISHESAPLWTETRQHASSLSGLFQPDLVDKATFDRNVGFDYLDMNRIPRRYANFDFCWSVCAIEHLGSIRHAQQFVENSLAVLKPGGVAIHTTEFAYLDGPTVDHWATVLPQRHHFEQLVERLTASGHRVGPVSFDVGSDPLDRFIDIPPYLHGNFPSTHRAEALNNPAHLKIAIDGIAVTCFGITVVKAE